MAIPIANLIQDQQALITISPNTSLQEAVGLMIENDFSQLPILENGKPYGSPGSFVTGASIARAMRCFGTSIKDLQVRDATVPARTVAADEDLFSKMDDLLDSYAVLVLNPDGTIAGIVTNYDTTQYFRKRAEDMLLVEDIESTLKDHIRAAFATDESDGNDSLQSAINALSSFVDNIRDDCTKAFRKFCGTRGMEITDADVQMVVGKAFSITNSERTFDDLTLNEYIQLARKDEAWKTLGPVFSIPDSAFLQMLEGVRKTRNKLMHFRPDVTKDERDHLRFCAEWFKNHPPVTEVEEGVQLTENETPDQTAKPEERITEAAPIEDLEDPAQEAVESKYAPLADFLLKVPNRQERLVINFVEIEKIIGDQLPRAAREHRSWWANDSVSHVQSTQWLKNNWRILSINMTEEKVVFARARDRERAYIDFFGKVRNRLRNHNEFPLHAANPTGANWITLAYLTNQSQRLILSFAHRQRLRLEFYIDTGDAHKNISIFDTLESNRSSIQGVIGPTIEWERLDRRRACRIAVYTEGSVNDEPGKLESLVDWSVENALRFHRALANYEFTLES